METNEKVLCVQFDDGTCTDVLVRNHPDKLEFEINHWLMGPLRCGITRENARLLLATLLELVDRKDIKPGTFKLG